MFEDAAYRLLTTILVAGWLALVIWLGGEAVHSLSCPTCLPNSDLMVYMLDSQKEMQDGGFVW